MCFLGYIPVLAIGELERQAVGCAVFFVQSSHDSAWGLRGLVFLVCFLGYIPVLSIGVLGRQAVGFRVCIQVTK